MSIIEAVILGVIQGITEFLPVSSTGHLVLFSHLFGLTDDSSKLFDVAIQGASVFAIVFLLWARFRRFFDFQGSSKEGFSGWRAWGLVAVGCFPAALTGYALHGFVKSLYTPLPVASALIFGGMVMLWVEHRRSTGAVTTTDFDSISFRQALLIGVIQVAALWPGISRSGATIIGGMIAGLSRSAAAEFSFLLSAPLLAAAATYDLYRSWHLVSAEVIPAYATGFVVAGVVSGFAISWLLTWLKTNTFRPFAWYRIVLGGVLFVVLLTVR